jgi:WD40 repeat protein
MADQDDVFSVAFSADSKWLTTASDDGVVELWRTEKAG